MLKRVYLPLKSPFSQIFPNIFHVISSLRDKLMVPGNLITLEYGRLYPTSRRLPPAHWSLRCANGQLRAHYTKSIKPFGDWWSQSKNMAHLRDSEFQQIYLLYIRQELSATTWISMINNDLKEFGLKLGEEELVEKTHWIVGSHVIV